VFLCLEIFHILDCIMFCRINMPVMATLMSRQHLLTYIYLLVYISLSSGVILYNKVRVLGFPNEFFRLFFLIYLLLWYVLLILFPFVDIGLLQWVLSTLYFNFPFPITLTMIHMAFSGGVAFFLIRVLKVRVCLSLSNHDFWLAFSQYTLAFLEIWLN